MEIINIVNHQRRRMKNIKIPLGFEPDHIIPYSICLDNSKKNIQFLRKKEHQIKTRIDHKIIKKFRERGWIEKITHYSHELKIPINKLKGEYKIMFKEMNKMNKMNR